MNEEFIKIDRVELETLVEVLESMTDAIDDADDQDRGLLGKLNMTRSELEMNRSQIDFIKNEFLQ